MLPSSFLPHLSMWGGCRHFHRLPDTAGRRVIIHDSPHCYAPIRVCHSTCGHPGEHYRVGGIPWSPPELPWCRMHAWPRPCVRFCVRTSRDCDGGDGSGRSISLQERRGSKELTSTGLWLMRGREKTTPGTNWLRPYLMCLIFLGLVMIPEELPPHTDRMWAHVSTWSSILYIFILFLHTILHFVVI